MHRSLKLPNPMWHGKLSCQAWNWKYLLWKIEIFWNLMNIQAFPFPVPKSARIDWKHPPSVVKEAFCNSSLDDWIWISRGLFKKILNSKMGTWDKYGIVLHICRYAPNLIDAFQRKSKAKCSQSWFSKGSNFKEVLTLTCDAAKEPVHILHRLKLPSWPPD